MAQFNSKAVVTITCGTTDAVVRYTLDGSSPSGRCLEQRTLLPIHSHRQLHR